jgi:outer membrane phospholipase A
LAAIIVDDTTDCNCTKQQQQEEEEEEKQQSENCYRPSYSTKDITYSFLKNATNVQKHLFLICFRSNYHDNIPLLLVQKIDAGHIQTNNCQKQPCKLNISLKKSTIRSTPVGCRV